MNIGSITGSAFTSATAAIGEGTTQVQRVAQDVVDASTARPVEGVGKTTPALIGLKEGELSVSAGAKVLQAADKQLGTLVDTEA